MQPPTPVAEQHPAGQNPDQADECAVNVAVNIDGNPADGNCKPAVLPETCGPRVEADGVTAADHRLQSEEAQVKMRPAALMLQLAVWALFVSARCHLRG